MRYFLIILLFFCFSLTGCSNNSIDDSNKDNNYTLSRTITTENNNTDNSGNTNANINNSINNINVETEIASFSTKIYTPNDKARQNNIRITSSKLNGTVLKAR